jgi:hypothetical protein
VASSKLELSYSDAIYEERPQMEQEAGSSRQLSTVPADVKPVRDNKITVLFSTPLVFKDDTETESLRPFAKLDFEME